MDKKKKKKKKKKEKIRAFNSDTFLKLKQFLYLDGNYKKRSFILDNFASGLCYRMWEEFYTASDEICALTNITNMYRITNYKNIDKFIDDKTFTRLLQLYGMGYFGAYNYRTADIWELNKYLHQLLENEIMRLKIPLSYIAYYFERGMFREKRQTFRKFNSLSLKYKLYIYDLISPINYDYSNCLKEWIAKKDEPEDNIYAPFPTQDFGSGMVNIEELKKSNLNQKRLLGLLSLISNGDEIKRNHGPALRNMLTHSHLLSQLHQSYETRRIGLYLWDMCKNPLNPEQIDYDDLINYLYNINIRYSSSKEEFRRMMRIYIDKSTECIKQGKFLPYTNESSAREDVESPSLADD